MTADELIARVFALSQATEEQQREWRPLLERHLEHLRWTEDCGLLLHPIDDLELAVAMAVILRRRLEDKGT